MKRFATYAFIAMVFVCVAIWGLRAYQRLATELREKDSVNKFGYFLIGRMSGNPSFLVAFADPEVVREAQARRLSLQPVAPGGEAITHDVRGTRFVAWSACSMNGSYRAFLSNGYSVYWLRDEEVSWRYQTFRSELTPSHEQEELEYRQKEK